MGPGSVWGSVYAQSELEEQVQEVRDEEGCRVSKRPAWMPGVFGPPSDRSMLAPGAGARLSSQESHWERTLSPPDRSEPQGHLGTHQARRCPMET